MNKNYPVESNQAKWLSELVDFHVDSIVSSAVSVLHVQCHVYSYWLLHLEALFFTFYTQYTVEPLLKDSLK